MDIKEAKVEVKPPLRFNVPALLCAAKIVSAGPNHLGSLEKYNKQPTRIEAGTQIINGIKFNFNPRRFNLREKLGFKKSSWKKFCAAIINTWATPETIIPIIIDTNKRATFSIIIFFF